VGISVDPCGHNRAMVEKLDLPFPLLSDPRGDLTKTLDLWNKEEDVSEPAILVVDKLGTLRRQYSGGRDFSDRPTEEGLFAVLDEVGTEGEPEGAEAKIRVSAGEAARDTVRPDKPAMTLEQLGPYYLGTYYATVAMQKKLDGEARDKVDDFQDLVEEYNSAIRETADRNSS
jgi:hypothetical protein